MMDMKEVYIRFPNESEFLKITINMDDFEPKNWFEAEIFGWYKGIFVSIKR